MQIRPTQDELISVTLLLLLLNDTILVGRIHKVEMSLGLVLHHLVHFDPI